MIKTPKKHIVISEEIKEQLDKLGNKGDTYEDIIIKLIKGVKNEI